MFVDKPRVFGTAIDWDLVKTFPGKNILTMDSGSIVGMNGLIIGIAKLRGMQGPCFIQEKHQVMLLMPKPPNPFWKVCFQ